jgi:signal transduction histidine kinase
MQQNMQNEIPLHDIKPLLEIQDYSFYYFLAVVTVVALIIVGILYLLYRHFYNKKRFNIRKEHYKILQGINLQETKKAAYELTEYGATFANDSERHQKTYNDMLEKLQKYKYKKSVDDFDSETLRIIELYRGMIDV